jgi:hypothetical protein
MRLVRSLLTVEVRPVAVIGAVLGAKALLRGSGVKGREKPRCWGG